ncbi:hypothetical protein RF55_20912 [Lasius niger]|uniref:Peptidase A2 domain-containing protein n=1 Tax=Lasius niger TaxID=67767 RepID=A0A0J7MRH1_LASNI|nr:hypothetical protein RF55_20912 [Lasius niger]
MLHEAYVPPKQDEVSALSAVRKVDERTATLLAIARVIVTDRHGDPHTIRALIDQGSEVSIISEALVQRLRLRRSHSTVSISGIGGASTGATRGKVSLSLSSKITNAAFSAVAYILPRLSAYQGSTARNETAWPHLHGLPLADPQYMEEDLIELLLGVEVCSIILEDGLRKGGPRAPIAQKTSLGWILSGGCGGTSSDKIRSSHQCTADHELVDLVRRFWEQEKQPTASTVLTPDEEKCEEFFVRTHKRTTSGRYVVRLPFSTTPATLAETRRSAERLLSAMERKCEQDSRFGNLYRSFMQEYEDLKHMEPVINRNRNDNGQRCFLPHHGVRSEHCPARHRDSATTTAEDVR